MTNFENWLSSQEEPVWRPKPTHTRTCFIGPQWKLELRAYMLADSHIVFCDDEDDAWEGDDAKETQQLYELIRPNLSKRKMRELIRLLEQDLAE